MLGAEDHVKPPVIALATNEQPRLFGIGVPQSEGQTAVGIERRLLSLAQNYELLGVLSTYSPDYQHRGVRREVSLSVFLMAEEIKTLPTSAH